MTIKDKAKQFAIKAHKGQVRKSDPQKPMIIHPINVANILEEYGFDENVIAAGFLHDVVEDTKYTLKDIEKNFGTDIASLVNGASKPDKSLSWEERKKHTIENTKNLDLRHKAVICADKISNLEDLRILSEIKGEYDFSAFKRGFESQKWYYTEVFNSLIYNEDKDLDIFIRLKELIDDIFYKEEDNYVKDVIFEKNIDEYCYLRKINFKNKEIFKLRSVLSKKQPYVIELTGTPRTGKTSLINNLADFFKKQGFSVKVVEEFTTSNKYKKEIKPLLKDKYVNIVNIEIPKYVLEQLNNAIKDNFDIIIIDRSLCDRLIWVDRLVSNQQMTTEEYDDYKKTYLPLIKDKIDIVISLYTDSLTALRRDYNAHLSLEKRSFLNEQNIYEYNQSLLNIQKLLATQKINFNLFDTTNKNQRQISLEVIDKILCDMKEKLIQKLNEEFK